MSPKAELIQPFVAAAAEVLRAEAGVDVKRGNLALESTAITLTEVAALVSLIGQIEGVVVFAMSESMCLALVSRMLGQNYEQLDELALSGVAELGNVISGQAATKLSKAGYQVSISVPTIIMGQGATIATVGSQRLVVPLETELGTMQIHLAVRENRG